MKSGKTVHLIVWGGVLLYFFTAPYLYINLFAKQGLPIQADITLLASEISSYSFVDGLDLYNEQGLYQLRGWGFLTINNIPVSDYEKKVVLVTGKQYMMFDTQIVDRRDVKNEFGGLNLDLRKSGFLTLIAKEALQTGRYGIWIMFTHKDSEIHYYVNTGRCLERTPNFMVLSELEENCPIYEGLPIHVNIDLPTEVDQHHSFVDDILPYSLSGVYQMRGWAFLTINESRLENYRRSVVLISKNRNIVFEATPMERQDVQLSFDYLELDVKMSGFSTLIDSSSLETGSYKIGLQFEEINGNKYFIDTGQCLRLTSNDQLILDTFTPMDCLTK